MLYYDLLTPDGREKIFGPHMRDREDFVRNPYTGQPKAGDTSDYIKLGRVVPREEAEEFRLADAAITDPKLRQELAPVLALHQRLRRAAGVKPLTLKHL